MNSQNIKQSKYTPTGEQINNIDYNNKIESYCGNNIRIILLRKINVDVH